VFSGTAIDHTCGRESNAKSSTVCGGVILRSIDNKPPKGIPFGWTKLVAELWIVPPETLVKIAASVSATRHAMESIYIQLAEKGPALGLRVEVSAHYTFLEVLLLVYLEPCSVWQPTHDVSKPLL
jgi:hypothetical protein